MKIAVVTGASSGIGREFVYAVDKEEIDEIWVIARRKERLEDSRQISLSSGSGWTKRPDRSPPASPSCSGGRTQIVRFQ